MEAALSADFTDKVLEKLEVILSHHQDRVVHLTESQKRIRTTSDPSFVYPFTHAVTLGLYSGENQDNFLIKHFKLASCYHSADVFYSNDKNKKLKMQNVKDALKDIFDVSYGLSSEFRDIENLRDSENRVKNALLETGLNCISLMADALHICVIDTYSLSNEIWYQYSKGIIPRFFKF